MSKFNASLDAEDTVSGTPLNCFDQLITETKSNELFGLRTSDH
jgi:hypothetical protein